jgi:PilZ domain
VTAPDRPAATNDHPEEKREDPRQPRKERAFIRILLGDGAAVSTKTEDLSRGGFRSVLPEAIDAGSILHVVIELEPTSQRFLLAAEVRWCRREQTGEHHAGFALLDARGTDYDAWREHVQTTSGEE